MTRKPRKKLVKITFDPLFLLVDAQEAKAMQQEDSTTKRMKKLLR